MRILQLGKFWAPDYGGIERVVESLSRGLAERGHQVETWVAASSKSAEVKITSNLKLCRFQSRGQLFSQALCLLPSLKDWPFQPDLVHIHLPNPLWAWQISKMKMTTPLAITVHADLSQNPIKNQINQWAQKALLHQAHSLIFTSSWNKKLISRDWQADLINKSLVIPLGVRPPSSFIREDHEFILFVGRWVSYKGLSQLLEACAGLAWPLVLAGGGPEELRLRQLTKKLKMEQQCKFVLNPTDLELEKLYQNCSVVVLPSTDSREAFGLVLLEASLHEKPFIASDLASGLKDLLANPGATSVRANDVQDLRQKISEMMESSSRRLDLGRKSAAYSRENFSLQTMVDRHESLYKSLYETIQKSKF